MIEELIDKTDNLEVCQDRIYEILSVEIAHQMELAEAAELDPTPWDIRVFRDRQFPWEVFYAGDLRPVVNVSFSRSDLDQKSSGVVNGATYVGDFFVDVYGFGESSETEEGQDPADEMAAREARRAFRIVRNILLAGQNTDFSDEITTRLLTSIEGFTPPAELVASGSVYGIRGTVQLRYPEETPQVTGEGLGEFSFNYGLSGETIIYPVEE